MSKTTENESCSAETIRTVQELTEDLASTVLPVTVFIGIEAIVGFVGNILILTVYAKWYVHCNFRYFVLSLAVYDFTSCITTLPGEIFSQLNWYDYQHAWICKLKSYFNVFTAWGSAFTLLLLAFDRYRKICRPLAWQIQPSFALKLCICGIILASFVSSPITILWGKQTYEYTLNGMTLNVSICEKSGQYADEDYPFIYVTCVYILPIGLMMLAISVCNVLIARKLFCKTFQHGLKGAGFGSTIRKNYTTSVSFKSEESSATIRRNATETSDLSGLNSVSTISSGLHRTLGFSASLVSTEERKAKGVIRRNSLVSLSAVSLKEMTLRRSLSVSSELNHCSEKMQESASKWSCSVTDNCKDLSVLSVCESSPPLGTESETTTKSDVRETKSDERDSRSERGALRQKAKTLIMLILTSVFIVTMTLYVALLSLVAEKNNILKRICNTEKVVFFFFWRIYFINCIINPILYGLMDPRFRAGLKRIFRSCKPWK